MKNYTPSDPKIKYCPKCQTTKPVEGFHLDKGRTDGYSGHCKACRKTYGQQNKEKLSAVANEWRRNNMDRSAAHVREWRQNNPDKVVEIGQRGYQKNRDKYDAKDRRRRARKLGAEGSHTAEDVKRQYKAQQGCCYYCNVKVGKKYDVDHIVPLSRGGSNSPENLVIACRPCNRSKGSKMPHEWAGSERLL